MENVTFLGVGMRDASKRQKIATSHKTVVCGKFEKKISTFFRKKNFSRNVLGKSRKMCVFEGRMRDALRVEVCLGCGMCEQKICLGCGMRLLNFMPAPNGQPLVTSNFELALTYFESSARKF